MTTVDRVIDSTVPYVSKALGKVTLTTGLVVSFAGYLSVVRFLRFRRFRRVHAKYQRKYEAGKLTPDDAQRIMQVSLVYDMPHLLSLAAAFTLFKLYAVPSISKMLSATKELKSDETISRRYSDTEILISTWMGCPISGYRTEDRTGELDPRAMIAIARVNYLHSKYNIPNDDFLYNLILWIFEPIIWAKKYGWRALSPMEEHAIFTFWVEIGKRMGMQDIPESFESMREWARVYEEKNMVEHPTNGALASYTTEEILYSLPTAFGIRQWADNLTTCLLDEPVRISLRKPAQPWYNHLFVRGLLHFSAFVQKWLMLPRSDSNPSYPVLLELPRNKDGSINPRMYPNKFRVRPWYKPESKTFLGKIRDRLLVLMKVHSHVPGPLFHSDGYRLEELGPSHLEKTANEEVLEAAAVLQGCPITGAFTQR